MTLSFQLTHRFPTTTIDVAFEVPEPGVTVLFGPSGAGKSTAIAVAAGLLRPDRCRVAVNGTVLADTDAGLWLPPERRRVGLVFQDFAAVSAHDGGNQSSFRFASRAAGPGAVR